MKDILIFRLYYHIFCVSTLDSQVTIIIFNFSQIRKRKRYVSISFIIIILSKSNLCILHTQNYGNITLYTSKLFALLLYPLNYENAYITLLNYESHNTLALLNYESAHFPPK